ncbi:MAG: proline racemase family protein, partial [Microvirga sp.]
MSTHTFFCVDGHTCGNPVRMVAGGAPVLEGADMIEKRAHFLAEYDWIRTGLMFEPRGHDVMSGSILYPPTRDDADIAFLFIETSGCLPMCGHGTIGTVTMALERGLVKPREEGVLKIDTPAGLVTARYTRNGDYVDAVRITNIASYLHATGLSAEIDELGEVTVDVAYGGNFYAI